MKKLLYFSGIGCEHCKKMNPSINNIKKQIQINEIQSDYEPNMVEKYKVEFVPTLILLENEKEIRRFTGVKTEHQIIDWLNG